MDRVRDRRADRAGYFVYSELKARRREKQGRDGAAGGPVTVEASPTGTAGSADQTVTATTDAACTMRESHGATQIRDRRRAAVPSVGLICSSW